MILDSATTVAVAGLGFVLGSAALAFILGGFIDKAGRAGEAAEETRRGHDRPDLDDLHDLDPEDR